MKTEPPSGNADSSQPADRLAKALFDNVPHELKTPLTVICAALEVDES
jgi:K+-sensing histidine kinase KdpD